MSIEIAAVGGYSEFGRNMTAVRVDDEVIIIDMGIHLENYIGLQGHVDVDFISVDKLLQHNAIPKFNMIGNWRKKVKAIVPTHAHLDHVGAIPYISNLYNAKIVCTPFTAEVIKSITDDKRKVLRNPIKILPGNSKLKISSKIMLEFIHVTHSTPHTVMVALHTPYGTVLYANDFKFDSNPTLGAKPNMARLGELKNVKAMIVDCTRAWDEKKCPSEAVAKEMLKDVMLGTKSDGHAVIVTTFSSHIARLKSIVDFGRQMNREIIMLGRSLARYVNAAEAVKLVNFHDVKIIKYKQDIQNALKKVSKNPGKYLLVVTGHQGEPAAVLSRIASGELEFKFHREDHIIFSCSIIPNEQNIEDRRILENNLRKQHLRIFKDLHVSGHAAREDLRDLLNLVKPELIIPAHGDRSMMKAMRDLAIEMQYKEKDVKMMKNGDFLKVN